MLNTFSISRFCHHRKLKFWYSFALLIHSLSITHSNRDSAQFLVMDIWTGQNCPLPCAWSHLSPHKLFLKQTSPFPASFCFWEELRSSPCPCSRVQVHDHHCQVCSDPYCGPLCSFACNNYPCSNVSCYSINKRFHWSPSTSSACYFCSKKKQHTGFSWRHWLQNPSILRTTILQ